MLNKLNDFQIIPLSIPPLLTLAKSTSPLHQIHYNGKSHNLKDLKQETPLTHYLFIRPHESSTKSSNQYPKGKTLFVVNLPFDTSRAHLQRLFRHCGTIERIEFHSDVNVEEYKDFNPIESGRTLKSGSNAHLVFENEDAVERVLNMKDRMRVWSVPEGSIMESSESLQSVPVETTSHGQEQAHVKGLYKWIQEYLNSIPETHILQSSVDKELIQFEEFELQMKSEALAKRNVPDADGFITVTRAGGRRNTNKDSVGGASVVAVSQKQVSHLKPKNKELPDFYRFQLRENKRNQLADLRQQFELDKKRIQELRGRRKFKPY